MGKVFTHMTMSLDGYIADPDDQVGELFEWYEAGEVSVANANEDIAFNVDEASAEALRDLTEKAGALVSGRRLFDIADGWNDATRSAHRSSWSPTAHPRTPPSGGRRRRSSTESRRRSSGRGRSPATRTSRSPAPTSSSRHSTSAWSTRCASASFPCCSAKASRTSPSWSADTCCSRTRSWCRDAVPCTCGTRSVADLYPLCPHQGSNLGPAD